MFSTSTSHSRAKKNKPTDVATLPVKGDDGDFLALGPAVQQRKQTQPPPTKRKSMTLLDSSKKKKKKKGDQLLNFLSSLNN
jgi:hypothetical protein